MTDYDGPRQPVPYQPDRMSAVQTWTSALVPSQANYERIVNDPGASIGKAYLWVLLASILSAVLTYIVSLALNTGLGAVSGASGEDLGALAVVQSFYSAFGLLCAIPLALVFFIIVAVLVHVTARLLSGQGTFTQLSYGLASFNVPMSAIIGVLAAIPVLNCLLFPIGLYNMVLGVHATKAAYRFGWGQALVAYLAPLIVLIILTACVVIGGLVLLGPAIGEVFSNIVVNI